VDNTTKIRNITLGLIDGLTVPFALAAGLSGAMTSSSTIVIACLATSVAGAVTMTVGGFITGKKYEPSNQPLQSALIIGLSYVAGGILTSSAFFFTPDPIRALKWSALITFLILLVAGYYDSRLNGANGIAGASRVVLTGAFAAASAYVVARLFF
jgi:VIT1/CCC1 family predicted Fe2+/Mn2+ transporter